MYKSAIADVTVVSHVRAFPACHGIKVRLSGILMSSGKSIASIKKLQIQSKTVQVYVKIRDVMRSSIVRYSFALSKFRINNRLFDIQIYLLSYAPLHVKDIINP